MEELQQLQAERLNRLLVEQNISQKDLAERIKVSPTSVNHWVNGKVHMNDYNASRIHDAYPQYSAEWLRGYSEYPNETEAMRDRRKRQNARFYFELDCVEGLLELNGADIEYYDECVEDGGECTITLENGESFSMPYRYNEFAKLTKDGQSVSLTMEQWRAFRNEIVGYADMRLSMMLERGGW